MYAIRSYYACSVKRLAVAMYEAELNMVIHAGGGIAEVEVLSDRVMVTLADEGSYNFV